MAQETLIILNNARSNKMQALTKQKFFSHRPTPALLSPKGASTIYPETEIFFLGDRLSLPFRLQSLTRFRQKILQDRKSGCYD
jgi:hypothetical protein